MWRKFKISQLGYVLAILSATLMIYACQNQNGSTEGPDNEKVLQVLPGNDNPRNSEGDFITLNDGRILFVYSRYTGESTSDHSPAFLAGRFSSDKGKTWTDEDEVILENEGGMNVMSVSLLRLKNGHIALFYLTKNSMTDCIPTLRISKDEAETWSEPVACITDKQGYFVLNNNRAIQLADGRLMFAVALHQTPDGEWSKQGKLYAYFSDDGGQTWTSSVEVPNENAVVTQEPGLVELEGGQILMYIRASGGSQHVSYSSDRGETWSPVEASNIPSPLSPATIARVPETGDLLLVWNNNDGTREETKDKRTPLTIAVSKDEGKTWTHVKDIETDQDGWYCYTAVHFTDDNHVLLSYCAGSVLQKTQLSVTDIRRMSLDWVYQ